MVGRNPFLPSGSERVNHWNIIVCLGWRVCLIWEIDIQCQFVYSRQRMSTWEIHTLYCQIIIRSFGKSMVINVKSLVRLMCHLEIHSLNIKSSIKENGYLGIFMVL